MRILVVEDTKDLNKLIVKTLSKNGYSADGCFNGEEALQFIAGAEYDAILLDVMMPKMDGYQFVSLIRERGNETPVLFLTARDAIEDRVKGLDLGADDYLVKPFDFDELLARIRAMTRKRSGVKTNRFTLDDLVVDVEKRAVYRSGIEIQMLPKEFTLLEYMIRNQGIVLSREQLEDRIWNYEYSGSSNNIDGYMSRIRKKIDGSDRPKLLHTVRGVGWVLRKEESAP